MEPVTEAQVEYLRRMGREAGWLAVPAHGGARLDKASLTPAQWAFNWRVWTEPGFAPHARFIEPWDTTEET